MSAPSSSSEKSSIWSVLNIIIGSAIGGVVLLWVLAFVFDGLGSLRPKSKAEAPKADTAAAPLSVASATAATPAPAAPAAAPAIPASLTASLPVLEVTIKPDTANPLAYDTKAILAKVGQKVKVTFNNTHPTLPQPHNFVLGKLGTKDKMMTIAMSGMTLVDKGYIPDSPDILAHTHLLQPGSSETIEFTLPAAGEYPYFCTFPGHVAIMNGILTAQ